MRKHGMMATVLSGLLLCNLGAEETTTKSVELVHGPDRVKLNLDKAEITYQGESGTRILQAHASNFLDWGYHWPQPGPMIGEPELTATETENTITVRYDVEFDREFVLTARARRGVNGIEIDSALYNRGRHPRRDLLFWDWTEPNRNYQTRDAQTGIWSGTAAKADLYLPAVVGDFDVDGWVLFQNPQTPDAAGFGLLATDNVALAEKPASYLPHNAMLTASPREQVLLPGEAVRVNFALSSPADAGTAADWYAAAAAQGSPAVTKTAPPLSFDGIEYGVPAPEWLRQSDKYSFLPAQHPWLPNLTQITPPEVRDVWGTNRLLSHVPEDLDQRSRLRAGGLRGIIYYNWMEIYDTTPDNIHRYYGMDHHPEWKALDQEGRPVISGWGVSNNLSNLFATCVHQRSLLHTAVRQMRELIEQKQADGVFIDNAFNLTFCQGDKFGHRHVPGKNDNELYMELLQAVYNTVKSYGDDYLVMQNNGNSPAQWSFTDSGMAEETVEYVDWDTLEYKGVWAAEAARRGKVPVTLSYLNYFYDPAAREYVGGDGTPEQVVRTARFAYAYCRLFDLLWSDGGTLLAREDLYPWSKKFYGIEFLKPLGDRRVAGAVNYRLFDNGAVILNSDRRHPAEATIPLPRSGRLQAPLTLPGEENSFQTDEQGKLTVKLPPYGSLMLLWADEN